MATYEDAPPIGSVAFDGTLVVSVPFLLAAIHFLIPPTLQNAITLHPDNQWFAFLTTAYVHNSDAHLFGNIVGYALATGYAYYLCLQAGLRQWFRRTLLASLIVLPPLVNLASRAIFLSRYGQVPQNTLGFSGVAAGLGGFLLVALGVYLATRYNRDLGQSVALATFLLLMLEVDLVYSGGFRLPVTGLVFAGWALIGGSYGWEHDVRNTNRLATLHETAIVVVVLAVLSYIVLALFPANVVSDGSMTNVFAHAAGFLYGGTISAILFKVD